MLLCRFQQEPFYQMDSDSSSGSERTEPLPHQVLQQPPLSHTEKLNMVDQFFNAVVEESLVQFSNELRQEAREKLKKKRTPR